MSGVVTNVTLASGVRTARHLLGVRGGSWLAEVNERGRITPRDGSAPLDWFVAADDRWHDPSVEPTVRQQRRAGVPVIETRLRVPSGDVVQRVWAIAEGFVVAEFTNASSMPIAVALTRGDIHCVRPPGIPQGIDLPAGSVVFPVSHSATLMVALPMVASAALEWPVLATADDMQRTWLAAVERAGYALVPDKTLTPRINTVRSDLLASSALPIDEWDDRLGGDGVALSFSLLELTRMGERIGSWPRADDVLETLATSMTRLLRQHRKSTAVPWDVERALFAAQWVLTALGDERGSRDVASSHARLAEAEPPPSAPPGGVRLCGWLDELLASPRRDGSVAVLGHGIPALWQGVNFECHGVAIGVDTAISYALRWHGDKPALLWEIEGATVPLIHAGRTDPTWSTREARGETLLGGFLP